jgi:hypothetical protein
VRVFIIVLIKPIIQTVVISLLMGHFLKRPFFKAFVLTAIFILYSVLVYGPRAECFELNEGIKSLGLSFSYNFNTVITFFEARTREQLECYEYFLTYWDVVFAALYAIMYAAWINALFSRRKLLWLTPVIFALTFDWMENYFEIQMILDYLEGNILSEGFIKLGSAVNSLKWICSWTIFIVLIVGTVKKLKNIRSKAVNGS